MTRSHATLCFGLFVLVGCNAILDNEEGILVVGGSANGGSSGVAGSDKPRAGGSTGGSASDGAGMPGDIGGEPGTSTGGSGQNVGGGGSGSGGMGGTLSEGGVGGMSLGGSSGSGGSGGKAGSGGTGGTGGKAGAGGVGPTGGAGGAGGSGGKAGSGGTGTGGSAGAGGSGPTGPYAPRSGTFKMLVYSKTAVGSYRHPSIAAGISLLQTIATEKGFTVEATETNEKFTAAGLAGFEIVFFMNTSGDVLTDIEQTAFQTWMTTKDGAWAGVHSATDTEASWNFYHELTGQYYSGHSSAGVADQIEFAAAFASHPAVVGLPNPWSRNDEWWNFSSFLAWQSKPGFHILGRKKSDGQPIVWDREIDNYRAFYCGLGHDAATFSDASVKKMLTGGILWAVRRQ